MVQLSPGQMTNHIGQITHINFRRIILLMLKQLIFQEFTQIMPVGRQRNQKLMASIMAITASLVVLFPVKGSANNTPETAPPELRNLILQIDEAASARNLPGVMDFYNVNFTHSDGLTYSTVESTVRDLWRRYPNISYRTKLLSWSTEGTQIIAETVTEISGIENTDNRQLTLTATVRSRQRYENQKLIRQDILAERIEINSGANPPKLKINLPEEVRVGERYTFDAIVEEPLGDEQLLGAALEEPVRVDKYLNPSSLDLELLSAGGIFKVGQAPRVPDNRWISAVVVRHDGITAISQRLRVVGRS